MARLDDLVKVVEGLHQIVAAHEARLEYHQRDISALEKADKYRHVWEFLRQIFIVAVALIAAKFL